MTMDMLKDKWLRQNESKIELMSKAQEAEQMQLDWSNIQYKVSKLQSKIYESSLKGDKKSVVKYQKILINSYNAKLLAVRRVTQDNKGKSTAGVDG